MAASLTHGCCCSRPRSALRSAGHRSNSTVHLPAVRRISVRASSAGALSPETIKALKECSCVDELRALAGDDDEQRQAFVQARDEVRQAARRAALVCVQHCVLIHADACLRSCCCVQRGRTPLHVLCSPSTYVHLQAVSSTRNWRFFYGLRRFIEKGQGVLELIALGADPAATDDVRPASSALRPQHCVHSTALLRCRQQRGAPYPASTAPCVGLVCACSGAGRRCTCSAPAARCGACRPTASTP